MTFTPDYIDQIVQTVMREMNIRGTARSATVAPVGVVPGLAGTGSAGTGSAGTGTVRISASVISESVLVAAQAAGRSVQLPAGAVITPSGRDYIRRHRVTLSGAVADGRSAAVAGRCLVIGGQPACQSAASAAGWMATAVTDERDAAARALEFRTGGPVACCGGEPSMVACLLNRDPDVRAAVITRATSLLSLVTVMNPQVVCLDPEGWTFGDLLKLMKTFRGTGSRPSGWKEIRGANS